MRCTGLEPAEQLIPHAFQNCSCALKKLASLWHAVLQELQRTEVKLQSKWPEAVHRLRQGRFIISAGLQNTLDMACFVHISNRRDIVYDFPMEYAMIHSSFVQYNAIPIATPGTCCTCTITSPFNPTYKLYRNEDKSLALSISCPSKHLFISRTILVSFPITLHPDSTSTAKIISVSSH